MTNLLRTSTVTCPACDTETTATMPTESCQFFWTCPSYGSVPCPSMQRDGECCRDA